MSTWNENEVGISEPLANILREYKERATPEQFEALFKFVAYSLRLEFEYLRNLPPTSTRARVLHMRIDAAIQQHLKRHPADRDAVSCFSCTRSGCCHTQVDITETEATLLAERVRTDTPIDANKLAEQAALSDAGAANERSSLWAEQSFEFRRCVFLSEAGRCRIYEDRPAVCRKWHVAKEDPKNCDDIKHSGLILIVKNAEIISSASFGVERSGRLPAMLAEALKRK